MFQFLERAVGIGLKAPFTIRRLLIPLNSTNAKSALLAQVSTRGYTATSPPHHRASKNRLPRTLFLDRFRVLVGPVILPRGARESDRTRGSSNCGDGRFDELDHLAKPLALRFRPLVGPPGNGIQENLFPCH